MSIRSSTLLADIILLIHISWSLLLLGGTVYMLFNNDYVVTHLVIVTFTILLNLVLGECPLTVFETKLRRRGGHDKYNGMTFTGAYVDKYLGINLSTKQVNTILIGIKTVAYILATLILTGVI